MNNFQDSVRNVFNLSVSGLCLRFLPTADGHGLPAGVYEVLATGCAGTKRGCKGDFTLSLRNSEGQMQTLGWRILSGMDGTPALVGGVEVMTCDEVRQYYRSQMTDETDSSVLVGTVEVVAPVTDLSPLEGLTELLAVDASLDPATLLDRPTVESITLAE